jgi:hypothetical protein
MEHNKNDREPNRHDPDFNKDPKHDDPKMDPKDRKLLEEQRKADEERKRAMEREREKYTKYVGGNDNRGKDHNTPFIVMRFNTTDVGLRPIPSGTPHWACPDIWVESSSPLGNPVAGEENFLHARVFNFGAFDAMPVKVDFYWADPSLGLGPANMNIIGTEWVEVKSMYSKDVRCNTPWIPQFLNNGHECVEVNCSCIPLDMIKHPFQPVVDRHVGQRNLHVEQAAPAQAFKFQVHVNNMFNFTLRNVITAKFQRLRIAKGFERQPFPNLVNEALFFNSPLNTVGELKNRITAGVPEYKTAQHLRRLVSRGKKKESPKFEVVASRSIPKIRSHISEHSTTLYNNGSNKYLGDRLVAQDLLTDQRGTDQTKDHFVLQTLTLKPFEQRELEFEIMIPGDAKPGEIIILQLAQEAENLTLGGYVYAFLIKNK